MEHLPQSLKVAMEDSIMYGVVKMVSIQVVPIRQLDFAPSVMVTTELTPSQ